MHAIAIGLRIKRFSLICCAVVLNCLRLRPKSKKFALQKKQKLRMKLIRNSTLCSPWNERCNSTEKKSETYTLINRGWAGWDERLSTILWKVNKCNFQLFKFTFSLLVSSSHNNAHSLKRPCVEKFSQTHIKYSNKHFHYAPRRLSISSSRCTVLHVHFCSKWI